MHEQLPLRHQCLICDLFLKKRQKQQEMSIIHTTREGLIKQRTAIRNSIRGTLTEFGIVCNKGWASLREAITNLCAEKDEHRLAILKECIQMNFSLLCELDVAISQCDQRIHTWCQTDEKCKLLLTLPGVGPITSSAIVCHMGDSSAFKNGRHFAAYVGLVPKHVGTGGNIMMLGISKRGDRYIRKLLVHGARSVMSRIENRTDRLGVWGRSLVERVGMNKACVALANKTARRCLRNASS